MNINELEELACLLVAKTEAGVDGGKYNYGEKHGISQ